MDLEKSKNTADAIPHFLTNVYNSLDSKLFALNILIDYRKAFYTVSHDILLWYSRTCS